MKVEDVMTHSAVCSSDDANVGQAVELMWQRNCGMLPIVGADKKLLGVVTDRDICIAMGTRNRLAGDLTLGQIATRNVFTCKPGDEITDALRAMAEKHVRRLPVVSNDGIPQGILSMDDIIAHADTIIGKGPSGLGSEEIIQTLRKLFSQDLPAVQTKSVAA